MNPKLKSALIYSAKNAVNALLTNVTFVTFFSNWRRETHTRTGWLELFHIALACMIGREITIWGPKLLAWSQTTAKVTALLLWTLLLSLPVIG